MMSLVELLRAGPLHVNFGDTVNCTNDTGTRFLTSNDMKKLMDTGQEGDSMAWEKRGCCSH